LTLPTARGLFAEFTGEAVVLEVLPGQWVFALLKGAEGWITDVHPELNELPVLTRLEAIRTLPADLPSPLPQDKWPQMATFANLDDPATVKEVQPNDLAATFGSGARVLAITYEVTQAPVTTRRVAALLPWIDDYYSQGFDGARYRSLDADDPFANSLSSGFFQTRRKE